MTSVDDRSVLLFSLSRGEIVLLPFLHSQKVFLLQFQKGKLDTLAFAVLNVGFLVEDDIPVVV